jgi:hypothetical protein
MADDFRLKSVHFWRRGIHHNLDFSRIFFTSKIADRQFEANQRDDDDDDTTYSDGY